MITVLVLGLGETILVAMLSAFVSSVALQYWFGPWLEARRVRLLEARKAEAELADNLRALLSAEWVYQSLPQDRNSEQNLKTARSVAQRFYAKNDLLTVAFRIRLRPGQLLTVSKVWELLGSFFGRFAPGDSGMEELFVAVRQTAGAVDPATSPWTRAWYWWRVNRLLKGPLENPDWGGPAAPGDAAGPSSR